MKKILLFGFSLFLLIGCSEVRIESNRRIEIRGEILDEEGMGLPGISVFSIAQKNTGLTSNTDKILGAGTTDANGSFNFTSLDSYTHNLTIAVNPSEFENLISRPSIYYTDLTGEHELSYNLGTLNLAEQLNFSLQIKNTSQTQDTLIYTIRFQEADSFFQFENGEFLPVTSLEDNAITLRQHRPDDELRTHTFTTVLGSEIRFAYGLGENAVQQILIPVNLQNTSYEFEY